jgi:GT2 family glycosyltransferase|tara:strand:+ start:409 stop:1041 length:633 start_codon:yes stop_codon:yes gene_type:complete
MAEYDGQECYVHRFQEWGGLTRSWNKGLQLARELECDYVICGNNDIVFPRLWHQGLLHALENGYHMVGPVSNAAGPTAKQHQEVWQYFPEYEVDDSERQIDKVQAYLLKHHLGHVIDHHVNGFFQMAALGTWWEGAYDSENVYCPRNEKTSRGHNNATPLMTLNEDELQGRWRRLGFKSGVVPSSFIFHYRAVTRGNRYRKGRWHRKQAL